MSRTLLTVLFASLLLLTTLLANSAQAQSCTVPVLSQREKWELPPGMNRLETTSSWQAASQRLEEIRTRLLAVRDPKEGAATVLNQQSATRLAQHIERILLDYDGTKATAHLLRLDDFKPRPCSLVPSGETAAGVDAGDGAPQEEATGDDALDEQDAGSDGAFEEEATGDDALDEQDAGSDDSTQPPPKKPSSEEAPPMPTEVPACLWELMHEPAIQVPMDASCEEANALAQYVAAIIDALKGPLAGHQQAAHKTLRKYAKSWERLVNHGYSQWPQEVLFNGLWELEGGWGPSANQFIFLHPTVGAGASNLSGANDEATQASIFLVGEVFGYLRYWADHKAYGGLSAAATLGNFQFEHGWGLGPVVHFSGLHLGYSVGVSSRIAGEHSCYLIFDVNTPLTSFYSKAPELLKQLF